MCGIAGIIDGGCARARAACAAMSAAMGHRGPDADGLEVRAFGGQFLGLAHRRLSVLDLSPLGGQPMTDPQSGNVMVYNGEIYNFATLRDDLRKQGCSFHGRSDTEVLLQALTRWGVAQTLRRLEGMYAFAFFDAQAKTMTLARDPLGIKPLYVAATTGDGFAFASEVRALLASGRVDKTLDRRGIAGFLAYGAVQHPFTVFAGIASLPPGAYQQFAATDRGWTKSAPTPFWKFPEPQSGASEQEALDALRATLDRAVCDHLVADVPVGIFLSGGLDSTVLAGLAARHSRQIRAFTVGFSDQPAMSEMALAAATAVQFGLPHTPINLPAGQAEGAVLEWLAAADQPSIDGLNTFVISKAVRKEGIKVALSGLGSDELFGGYSSFREVPRLTQFRQHASWFPSAVVGGMAGMLTARRPRAVGRKLREMMNGGARLSDIYFQRRRALSNGEMEDLGLVAAPLGLTADYQDACVINGFDESDAVRAVSELESRFYQGNMLLRDSDVMGMAHGLEIRVPYLDRRLLDTVHALPGAVRLPRHAPDMHLLRSASHSFPAAFELNGARLRGEQLCQSASPSFSAAFALDSVAAPAKHLLRGALGELLRPELTNRPKTGFTLPLARWMLGPLRGVCEPSLLACSELAGLPAAAVRRVWDEFAAEPAGPQWSRALALVALGDYLRAHL